jgi:hypothetical protein
MATTTSITSTYAGQFSGKYIASALLSAPTLDKGFITIKPNIKYKEVIKTVATTGLITDATCDFTPTSSLTLAEQVLQPKELQVNLQLCKKDFRSDWEAIQMGISVYDNLPPSFTDFLIAFAAGKVAEQTEQSIWSTSSATNGTFEGLPSLIESGSCVKVSGSATITSASIIAELGKIVDAIPSTVYGKEDSAIYLPSNMVRAYERALGQNNFQFQSFVGSKPLNFDGVPIYYCPGLPSSVAISAQKSNLFFGTGLMDDRNEVVVLDTSETLGDQNVRVIMRYTGAVQFGIAGDIVSYKVR